MKLVWHILFWIRGGKQLQERSRGRGYKGEFTVLAAVVVIDVALPGDDPLEGSSMCSILKFVCNFLS